MQIRIALSFDDGRKDNYDIAVKVLTKYNIPASFNIITSYIDGISDKCVPFKNSPLTKNEVISLSKMDLFEIAGHGKKHNNDFDNLIAGLDELETWCGFRPVGIASPESKLSFQTATADRDLYEEKGIKYIRLGARLDKYILGKRALRKMNSWAHSTAVARYVWRDSFCREDDVFAFPSIPVMHRMTVGEIEALIMEANRRGESIIFMFHSICKPDSEFYHDTWSWDYGKFVELCKLIDELRNKHKIIPCRVMDMCENKINIRRV